MTICFTYYCFVCSNMNGLWVWVSGAGWRKEFCAKESTSGKVFAATSAPACIISLTLLPMLCTVLEDAAICKIVLE